MDQELVQMIGPTPDTSQDQEYTQMGRMTVWKKVQGEQHQEQN